MIKTVIFDVDGVFTDGSFYYTVDGKIMKKFGAHDSDGIKILKDLGVEIFAISADKRGFEITNKRMKDLNIELTYVTEVERLEFVQEKFPAEYVAFMGDGLFDAPVLSHVKFGIAPANACSFAKNCADYVTLSYGGSGAVFEASLEIATRYFRNDLIQQLRRKGIHGSNF